MEEQSNCEECREYQQEDTASTNASGKDRILKTQTNCPDCGHFWLRDYPYIEPLIEALKNSKKINYTMALTWEVEKAYDGTPHSHSIRRYTGWMNFKLNIRYLPY